MEVRTINDLEPTIRAELNNIKEAIVNAVPDGIEQIYLFGSYAYGTPNENSDLDIYVVLKDSVQESNRDAGMQIRKAINRKRTADMMSMDIIAKKKKEFKYHLFGITLEKKVAFEGILIYG